MKKFYLIWYVAIIGVFSLLNWGLGINITNYTLIAGCLLLFVAMVAEGSLINGDRTRYNFKNEDREVKDKVVNASLILAIPLIVMSVIGYIT